MHAAIVTLLANTGLRVGELCALTLDDVDLKPRPYPATANDPHFFIGQRGEAITSSGVWRILDKYA